MRSLRTVGFVFLFWPVAVVAGETHPRTSTTSVMAVSSEPIVLRGTQNKAFQVGEKLAFVIKYEFVSAGTASMEVTEGPVMNGRPTIHIESRASSNGFVDSFFKVRDFNASTVDKESLISLNFHQNLKEGKYKVIRNTSFDYEKRSYVFQRIKKGKTTERSGPVDKPLHDILSAFFFARTLNLEPGDETRITVFSDEDVYQLIVTVHPKIQTISVPAGKFQCLRFDPIVIGDGIFKAKDGKMQLYVTNDNRRMPVLIRSKVFIGSFDAELASFDTPQAK